MLDGQLWLGDEGPPAILDEQRQASRDTVILPLIPVEIQEALALVAHGALTCSLP